MASLLCQITGIAGKDANLRKQNKKWIMYKMEHRKNTENYISDSQPSVASMGWDEIPGGKCFWDQ